MATKMPIKDVLKEPNLPVVNAVNIPVRVRDQSVKYFKVSG